MKDWSKAGGLNTGYGSYVYDSELEAFHSFRGTKLILFKNALPNTDHKSLLMISSEKGDTSIELGNKALKALFLKFIKDLKADY